MDAKGAIGMTIDPNVPERVPSGSSRNISIPMEPDLDRVDFIWGYGHDMGD